ncbi:transposase [uncultured Thermus sp.]|uniref:transposase n=1 Tax=uncultured Thermus sp. TaxID=157149 RepID=UPI00342E8BA7
MTQGGRSFSKSLPTKRRRFIWGRGPKAAGRRVIKVDPKYTSQDCPVCGHREKRPLWVREFTCPSCGALLHRDVAAAVNILAKARTEPSGTGLHPEPRSLAL